MEEVKEELYEFGGIFDITQEDFKEEEQESKFNEEFYVPTLKDEKCKNDEYVARIRFLPNVFSGRERKDRITISSYYATDPAKPDTKKYFTAVKKSGGNDIASNAFFMLSFKDSRTYIPETPFQIREACKQFRRNLQHYSLVQIITDKQHPELEGKILIFRYGTQINQMLDQLIKGDPAIGRPSVIPFDPFNGKDFILKITKGTNSEKQEVNSYLHSFFDDGIVPISLDGGKTRVQNTPEDKKKIYNWLVENSPKLSQVEQQSSSPEEDEKQLIEAVRYAISDSHYFNLVYKATYKKDYIGEAEVETVTNREQYEAPVVQSAPARPAVQSQTSKFRSLKAAAQEPVVATAPEPVASVQPASTETAPAKTVQPQPASNPNPSLSEMAEENKIDQMMGGDLSDIDDIQ